MQAVDVVKDQVNSHIAQITANEQALPLAVQTIAATVLLIAANVCSECTDSPIKVRNWEYTVASSVIALVFSLVGVCLAIKMPDTFNKKLTSVSSYSVTVGSLFALFLFLWWGIMAGIITFQDPFTEVSNGYFATWTGFVYSTFAIGVSASNLVYAAKKSTPLLGLGACAVILLCATSEHISDPLPCRSHPLSLSDALLCREHGRESDFLGESIYALVVAILTIILVVVFLALERGGQGAAAQPVKPPLLLLFVLLWVVLACIVTFRGPFGKPGNGYFGAWGGAGMAVQAAFAPNSTIGEASNADAGKKPAAPGARANPPEGAAAPAYAAAVKGDVV